MSVLHVIDKAELMKLATPSDLHAWWVTGINFALIAAAFALPAVWAHSLAWVVASVVLAGRALGLGILTHDTAHERMGWHVAVRRPAQRALPGVPQGPSGTPSNRRHRQ